MIAFAVWGSIIGGMAAFGPLVGGWLTTSLSWRWAFYINIPVGLIVMAGAARWIRESRDEHVEPGVDAGGFLTLTAGLASLVFGLIEGQWYGWWTPDQSFHLGGWSWPSRALSVVPIAFALAIIALAAFIGIEITRIKAGKNVLADLRLFRLRSFGYGILVAMIVSLGELGIVFILPLFLQGVFGYTAFTTGLVLLALAGGAFLASGLAAPLSSKLGAHRAVTLGLGLEAIGIISLGIILSPSISGWTLVPSLFIYGMGVGLATAQLESVILADVPQTKSGQASGIQTATQQVGSALGVALLGTVLALILGSEAGHNLARLPSLPAARQTQLVRLVKSTAGQIVSALRQQPHTEAIVVVVSNALTDATRWGAFVAAAFVVVGFVVSWLLPDTRIKEEQHPTVSQEQADGAGRNQPEPQTARGFWVRGTKYPDQGVT